ncbi:protein FAR1-RELATED SEQUENCE 5-like [Salvia miltiorrhiza]|uniref:protein FAR1-RELATED SEQUENCE 5-like n=1 Tax=Salvia miltiorrhiza TaxID=226208 RepID=UPI0025ACE384|nr:protein FAR1-RELATED SEQUENCE 5-like [Salvia miltiorrhiza]
MDMDLNGRHPYDVEFDLNVVLGMDESDTDDRARSHEHRNDEMDDECGKAPFGADALDAWGMDESDNYDREPSPRHLSDEMDNEFGRAPSGPGEKSTECVNDESVPDLRTDEDLVGELRTKFCVGTILVDEVWKIHVLYCHYAHLTGFSVRKGEQRYFGKDGPIQFKEFLCSCSGLTDPSRLSSRGPVYKKMITRTDCPAKLIVQRYDLGPFSVLDFQSEHNHELVPKDQAYLLRSNRMLTYGHKALLEAMQSAGIAVSIACKFMENESGGVGNVGFTRKDAYHHMERLKRATKVANGDSIELQKYFTTKSNEEPYFYWKYELDDDGRLMNFFFRDSRSLVDYEAFGDVLSVDTTYRTNRYNLVCTPFVGINHHRRNVLFGMAFMSDETTSSFQWLFETFLESMNGKEPTVIFTDQCQAMMKAIDATFKSARHRLCQWHINQNAPSHFGSLNGNVDFKRLWYKCMNRVDTEMEFEETWNEMIETYDLQNHSWFSGIYRLRRRWAAVFSRGIFTAGLLATSRSESTNRVIKEVSRASISLFEFVKEYEAIQTRWRVKEREEDTHCLFLPGQFVEGNELAKQIASVYTRTVYKIFEGEVTHSFNVILNEHPDEVGSMLEYSATSTVPESRVRKITFDPQNNHAFCTCGMWEDQGILCRHILKVYYVKNIVQIPEHFILMRWSKSAKQRTSLPANVGVDGGIMEYMLFVNQCMRQVYDIASFTKDCDAARALIIEQLRTLRLVVSAQLENENDIAGAKTKKRNNSSQFRDPKKIRQRYTRKTGNHFEAAQRARRRTTPRRNGVSKKKSGEATQESVAKKTINFFSQDTCGSLNEDLVTRLI